MMTDLKSELNALHRWKLKPGVNMQANFERLVSNEFIPDDRLRAFLDQQATSIISYAIDQSPYYQKLSEHKGFAKQDFNKFEDLQKIPILDKRTLIDQEREFLALEPPPQEVIDRPSMSSGTSGMRSRVLYTRRARMMFSILMARNYRWFRLNPYSTFAALREPRYFTSPLDEAAPLINSSKLPHWHAIGRWFETGPAVYMTSTSPLEKQHEWLLKHQPSCLQAYPSVLEEHAFANPDIHKLKSLSNLVAISSELSDPMRSRVEASFNLPVDQNYGLNEFGMVAVRCQAGRYHPHIEHCIVEITDLEGKQVNPGERGRITVTSLSNLVMPLLRYDTGDFATLSKGDCPCGRTLPSFEDISGRYLRWVHVPPGSRQRYTRITDTFEALPSELLTTVRGYQIHLDLDDSWILRVLSSEDISPKAIETVTKKWAESYPESAGKFSVERVDTLNTPINCKVHTFTTDYDQKPRNFDTTEF